MTNRARRRRMRQRRARARRRRGHSSRYSEPVDCSCFDETSDNASCGSRLRRSLYVGGTTCISIGIVCFFSHDGTGRDMTIIGTLSFVAGVAMLIVLIRVVSNSKKEGVVHRGGLTGVTVEQPGSGHLLPPAIPPHSPGALPPRTVPPRSTEFLHLPRIPPHATELVLPPRVPPHGTGTFLPSPTGEGYYPGGSPQVAGYPPTFIGLTSRNPSPVSWRTSRNLSPVSGHNSRNPSPVGGRTSRNPSPVSGRTSGNPSPFVGRPLPDPPSDRSRPTIEGGDPPPYDSVVSAKPWVDPPSYQEASSCLVPRADTNSSPTPSAPDISIAVEQYPFTSPSTSTDPGGSPSHSTPDESEYPPSAPPIP